MALGHSQGFCTDVFFKQWDKAAFCFQQTNAVFLFPNFKTSLVMIPIKD